MPLSAIPIGGYSKIEGNSVAIKVDNEVVILDMGLSMENYVMYQEAETKKNDGRQRRLFYDELLRADAVPDYYSIKKDFKNVKAVIPSHAHLDHVGAVPFGMKFFKNIPVIATPYTIAFIKQDLRNQRYDRTFANKGIDLIEVGLNTSYQVTDNITVEFINVTHSVPDSAILAIHTPYGIVMYAVDYKFDEHPQIGETPNYKRLKELGKKGVKCLILESLYADYDIETPSEQDVKDELYNALEGLDAKGKTIFSSTFSSHVVRLKTLIEAGQSLGRKVCLIGSSLDLHTSISKKLSKLQLSREVEIVKRRDDVAKLFSEVSENRGDYFLICTGHQGESGSVLSKIADGFYGFTPQEKDVIIFSSSVIPTETNQKSFKILEDKLIDLNLNIIKDIHTSGHAGLRDHEKMLKMIMPETIIPAHAGHDKAKYIKQLSEKTGIGNTILVSNYQKVSL
jgi:ribonuclease J